jgi:hypothetical protein
MHHVRSSNKLATSLAIIGPRQHRNDDGDKLFQNAAPTVSGGVSGTSRHRSAIGTRPPGCDGDIARA